MDEKEIDGIIIGDMLVRRKDVYLGELDSLEKPIMLTVPFYHFHRREIRSLAETGIPVYPSSERLAKSLVALRSYSDFLKRSKS